MRSLSRLNDINHCSTSDERFSSNAVIKNCNGMEGCDSRYTLKTYSSCVQLCPLEQRINFSLFWQLSIIPLYCYYQILPLSPFIYCWVVLRKLLSIQRLKSLYKSTSATLWRRENRHNMPAAFYWNIIAVVAYFADGSMGQNGVRMNKT